MIVECVHVSVAAILGLRHRILRPGQPASAATLSGDHDPGTLHCAATISREVVSCLSLYVSEWQGSRAWQLRGMATAAAFQKQGFGRKLLDYALAEAEARQPSWPIWCNARVSAIAFYRKAGWRVESEEFEIDGIGPHVRMVWFHPERLPSGSQTNTRPPVAALEQAPSLPLASAETADWIRESRRPS